MGRTPKGTTERPPGSVACFPILGPEDSLHRQERDNDGEDAGRQIGQPQRTMKRLQAFHSGPQQEEDASGRDGGSDPAQDKPEHRPADDVPGPALRAPNGRAGDPVGKMAREDLENRWSIAFLVLPGAG